MSAMKNTRFWSEEDTYWFKVWIAALKNSEVEALVSLMAPAEFSSKPKTADKEALLLQLASPHGRAIFKAIQIKRKYK